MVIICFDLAIIGTSDGWQKLVKCFFFFLTSGAFLPAGQCSASTANFAATLAADGVPDTKAEAAG